MQNEQDPEWILIDNETVHDTNEWVALCEQNLKGAREKLKLYIPKGTGKISELLKTPKTNSLPLHT
eukprot:UN01029